MVAGTGVRIEGLKEFNRALKRVSKELPKITRLAHKDFAVEVSAVAKRNALSEPGGSIFAGLIRASAGVNFAGIRLKATHPAAAGWIFGSHSFGQFNAWVGQQAYVPGYGQFGPAAYAIGPAITSEAPRVQATYEQRVQRAFRGAFPK